MLPVASTGGQAEPEIGPEVFPNRKPVEDNGPGPASQNKYGKDPV